MSAGKPGKRQWTQNEVRRLKRLVKNTLDYEEIARLLDRTPIGGQTESILAKSARSHPTKEAYSRPVQRYTDH